MLNTPFKSEETDLKNHPESNNDADRYKEITMGDLHANALLFIHFLIKEGVLVLAKKEDYKRLAIYYNQMKSKESIMIVDSAANRFSQILSNATVHNRAKVRLLGDMLADRGNNDYLILMILKKLADSDVPIEIILSNHDLNFISWYEEGTFICPLMAGQMQSLQNLLSLLEFQPGKKKSVTSIINEHYKPNLKVLSYSLSQDKQSITVFTHAPVGMDTIKGLANKFGVTYNNEEIVHCPEKLALLIDGINEQFSGYVRENKVHTLFNQKAFSSISEENFPMENITWRRSREGLNRPEHILFVHGHDHNSDAKVNEKNVFILDSDLGKIPVGNLLTFTSNDMSLKEFSALESSYPPIETTLQNDQVDAAPDSSNDDRADTQSNDFEDWMQGKGQYHFGFGTKLLYRKVFSSYPTTPTVHQPSEEENKAPSKSWLSWR